jgi:hypothetical protein
MVAALLVLAVEMKNRKPRCLFGRFGRLSQWAGIFVCFRRTFPLTEPMQAPQPVSLVGSSELIKISPEAISFRDYRPDSSDRSMTKSIVVRNLTADPQTMLIQPPRTHFFELDINDLESRQIAPGLSVTLHVHFCLDQLDSTMVDLVFSDIVKIIVTPEKSTPLVYDVPLTAYPIVAQLECESLVDFGSILLNKAKYLNDDGTNTTNAISQQTTIRNIGQKDGVFRVVIGPGMPIRVSPDSFSLGPTGAANSAQVVSLEFFPQEYGQFQGSLIIKSDSEVAKGSRAQSTSSQKRSDDNAQHWTCHDETIELKSTVLERQMEIALAGRLTDLSLPIPFGDAYYTEKNVISVSLTNKGPATIRWVTL